MGRTVIRLIDQAELYMACVRLSVSVFVSLQWDKHWLQSIQSVRYFV